ncbi:MAG: metalloregulator ArsR/SmtB family transcription factor [Gammaproteobacteria bacterium]|nr:metalloregulator ArsR/SmtB family transcription factor [Gammaproteobacteria bacterium]
MNPQHAENLPSSWEKFAQFFSALGDIYRQKILLTFESGEELCVNQIASLFKLSRPAISHHLKVLKTAELLLCEKRGKEVYYRVNYLYCANVLKDVHSFVSEKIPKATLAELVNNDGSYPVQSARSGQVDTDLTQRAVAQR